MLVDRRNRRTLCLLAAISTCGLPGLTLADWQNAGGNSQRNGLSNEDTGDAPALLWSGGVRTSLIAWQPVIEGSRVFVVRQNGFPPEPNSDESPVVALNLDTGQELWFRNVPAGPNDWTTWIAGARDGRVYCARSGNGSSVAARMYALDAATGATVWLSADTTTAGAYDGVVFADNGDLIVADFRNITRIRAADGSTAWRVARTGSVSGTCGGALYGDAFYVVDAVQGGNAIKRFNATTGQFQYQSPTLPGFTIQNTPFVGPDGTVYLSRTQNNQSVDVFYALDDSGAAFTIRWSVPAAWNTNAEFAATADAVYMIGPGPVLEKRSVATGALLATTVPLTGGMGAPRMATDRAGRILLSNGGFATGRVRVFDSTLQLLWQTDVRNINIGGPAIGRDGTVVLVGVDADMRAYRAAPCEVDWNGDGVVDSDDFFDFLNDFYADSADFNGDGATDSDDFFDFLNAFYAGC